MAMVAGGCSTKKNTANSRRWHAFTARYNTYYNGHEAYKEGLLAIENANKDKDQSAESSLVEVPGLIGLDLGQALDILKKDGVKTKKTTIRVVESNKEYTKLHVTITEGKNRQVRKMFETVGNFVDFLKRIKIGDLTLRGLNRGEVRKLTAEEINYLKNL